MIKIARTNVNFEVEPLVAPFGFKGGYVSEIWQTVAMLESANACVGVGVGVQSVLWSDAGVFLNASAAGGNGMMFLVTEFALRLDIGRIANDHSQIFHVVAVAGLLHVRDGAH